MNKFIFTYDRFMALDTGPHAANLRRRVASIPVLWDMEARFAQMDEFGDYRQLINIAAPPVETLGSPRVAREMARLGSPPQRPHGPGYVRAVV